MHTDSIVRDRKDLKLEWQKEKEMERKGARKSKRGGRRQRRDGDGV